MLAGEWLLSLCDVQQAQLNCGGGLLLRGDAVSSLVGARVAPHGRHSLLLVLWAPN